MASKLSSSSAIKRLVSQSVIHATNYATREGLFEEDNEAHLAIFVVTDPIYFEDALKSEKWRQAMDLEMEAINKNGTWELME